MADPTSWRLTLLIITCFALPCMGSGRFADPWNVTATHMSRGDPITCTAYCSADAQYCDGLWCSGKYALQTALHSVSDQSRLDIPFCYAVRYDDCHFDKQPFLTFILTLPQHRVAKAKQFKQNDTLPFDVSATDYLKGDFIGEVNVTFYNRSKMSSFEVVISASFQGYVNVSMGPAASAGRVAFAKMLIGSTEILLPELHFSAEALRARANSSYCNTKLNRSAFETLCDSMFARTVPFAEPTSSPLAATNDSRTSTAESVLATIGALIGIMILGAIVFIGIRRYRRSQLERLLLSIRGDRIDALDDDAMMIDVENAVGVESDLDILAHVDEAELQPRIYVGEPPARRHATDTQQRNSSIAAERGANLSQSRTRPRAHTSRDGRVYIALRDDDEFESLTPTSATTIASATRNTATRVRQRGFLTDADGDDLFQSETAMGDVEPIVVRGVSDTQSIDLHGNVLA